MKWLLLSNVEAALMESRFKQLAPAKSSRWEARNRAEAAERGGDQEADAGTADQAFQDWLKMLPPVLQKYRPLVKQDLHATTQLLDHTERGTRNNALSWIWAMDVGGDSDNSEWLAECEWRTMTEEARD